MPVKTKKAEIADRKLLLVCPGCSSKITVDHEKNVKAEVSGTGSNRQDKSGGLADEAETLQENTNADSEGLTTEEPETKGWLEELFS